MEGFNLPDGKGAGSLGQQNRPAYGVMVRVLVAAKYLVGRNLRLRIALHAGKQVCHNAVAVLLKQEAGVA